MYVVERRHALPPRPRDGRDRVGGRGQRARARRRSTRRRSSSTASFSRAPPAPRWRSRGRSTRSAGRSARTTPRPARRCGASTRRRTTPTSGAGVGIWSTPAIDRERGLLYVGQRQQLRREPTGPLADSILAIDYKTGELKWSTQFTYPDVFSAGNPVGKDADVGASPNLWTSDGRALVGAGDKAGVYHALDRDTGEVVWETTLTPGSFFGGEIGSAAFVDGKLIAVSNVGEPRDQLPDGRGQGVRPRSGDRRDPLAGRGLPGEDLRARRRGARRGVRRHRCRRPRRARHRDRRASCGRTKAPDRTGCGPSIVDGRVLWGYGFTLFEGPGEGGVISFEVRAIAARPSRVALRDALVVVAVVIVLARVAVEPSDRSARGRRPQTRGRRSRRRPGCGARTAGAPGVTDRTMMSGGVERKFQLTVPRELRRQDAAPDRARAARADASRTRSSAGMTASPTWRRGTTSSAWRRRACSTARSRTGWRPRRTTTTTCTFISDLLDLLEAELCVDPRPGVLDGHVERRRRCRRCSRAGCPIGSPRSRPVAGVEFSDACRRRPGAGDRVPRHRRSDRDLRGRRAERRAGSRDVDYWKGDVPPGCPSTTGSTPRCGPGPRTTAATPKPVEEQVAPEVRRRTWQALQGRHRPLHRRRRRPRLARQARTRSSRRRSATPRPRSTRAPSSSSSSSNSGGPGSAAAQGWANDGAFSTSNARSSS